ncbi:cytochrome-c peroxidase [Halopseudomonas salegens]|uniref:Methylamine utilization protein MauG n=1 Tax=Halopseudomonas salegens TaxID=1434072 RepID=A0A1H2FAQ9_9GAMM|nr:cytochrome c peroxidase [Halopseudomonas salegens]SDU04343.1 cytochrome c peroxidase [Halopseudomonas salegens]
MRWLALLCGFWVWTASAEVALVEQYRAGTDHWPAAETDPSVQAAPLARLPAEPPYPADNPYSTAKRALGKQLFFDRRLSGSQQLACASCHDPDLGWADGRRFSIGHNRQVGETNAPSIINTGYQTRLFWDGRAASLEQQTRASWTNPIEMAADPDTVVARLRHIPGYAPLFTEAFGDSAVDEQRIIQAIATFSRSLTSQSTAFDRFLDGESEALSDAQVRGLHLFRTKARCMNCHHGALLSDEQFHHLGTSFHLVGNFEGRYRQTGKPEHVGAFRTPGLRGIGATAPYLHTGMAGDLDTLLALYNIGWWQNAELKDKPDDIPTAQLSPLIKPLELKADELADLKAFLHSLTGDMRYMLMPEELPALE